MVSRLSGDDHAPNLESVFSGTFNYSSGNVPLTRAIADPCRRIIIVGLLVVLFVKVIPVGYVRHQCREHKYGQNPHNGSGIPCPLFLNHGARHSDRAQGQSDPANQLEVPRHQV